MSNGTGSGRNERLLRRRRKRRIRRIVTAAVSAGIILLAAAIVIAVIVAFAEGNKNRNTDKEESGIVSGEANVQPEEASTGEQPAETEEPGDREEGKGASETETEPGTQSEPETIKIELSSDDIGRGRLILVNRQYFYGHIGEDKMTDVYTYRSSAYKFRDDGMFLNPEAAERLNAMLVDFYRETNNGTVNIISTYRDLATQQHLYDARVEYYGSVEKAEMWVALPGASEHHTGLAVDLGIYTDDGESYTFTGEGEFAWINENCWKYGFILRYDSEKSDITGIAYEPWHFRYLGAPHAEIINGTDLCYEEYISYLKVFPYDGDHLFFTSSDGTEYEIFYIRSDGDVTTFELPPDSDYFVSGNNVDGFIVTVTLHGNP